VIDSSAEEKQISSPPWRWTVNLHESFQRQGLESIIFSARIGEKGVVSSAHLIGFDRKLALWKAGSTEEGYRSNAGSLVQSKIIEWAKDNGYVIYDMGGTDPRLPVYAGIHRFKSGFGGDLVANTILEKTPFFVRALRPAYGLLARIGLPYPR
jgi:lipid II:glycine glycyltransferase (peptidoglycan interpeptide bridge formation enzyme)